MESMNDGLHVVSVLEPPGQGGPAAMLLYTGDDPLVVEVFLWSSTDEPAVGRTILRSDLREASEGHSVVVGDLTIAWVTRRFARATIEGGEASAAALLPRSWLREFLAQTDDIVAPNERDETRAVDELVRGLIERVQP